MFLWFFSPCKRVQKDLKISILWSSKHLWKIPHGTSLSLKWSQSKGFVERKECSKVIWRAPGRFLLKPKNILKPILQLAEFHLRISLLWIKIMAFKKHVFYGTLVLQGDSSDSTHFLPKFSLLSLFSSLKKKKNERNKQEHVKVLHTKLFAFF